MKCAEARMAISAYMNAYCNEWIGMDSMKEAIERNYSEVISTHVWDFEKQEPLCDDCLRYQLDMGVCAQRALEESPYGKLLRSLVEKNEK